MADLKSLTLLWGFGFRLEPIFTPAASKNFKSGQKLIKKKIVSVHGSNEAAKQGH